MKRVLCFWIGLGISTSSFAGGNETSTIAPKTKSPEGAKVYFISPQNGKTYTSPVSVKFGLQNMGVAPAGTVKEKTGHHHILVDQKLASFDMPIPADKNHVHFGGGQTETKLELNPGKHTLRLVLADHAHIPHEPPVVSKTITITVK